LSIAQPDRDPPGDQPQVKPTSGPTVLRIALGAELRRLREASGISREAAGDAIRASHAKISRLELGRVSLRERDVADLLTLYGVLDLPERSAFLTLARQSGTPGWWQHYPDALPGPGELYAGLERASSVIRSYEPALVPGLLQTEACARAVTQLSHPTGSAEQIERQVTQRMKRQEALTEPGAPNLWAVIDEAALWRLGGRSAMRDQIRHLIEMAELPNVTLQAVPFYSGGYAAAGGPFTILRFSEPDLPDIVYLEQLTCALYLDRSQDVDHYLMIMDRLCVQAKSPAATAKFLDSIRKEI
jgi:transcriptional regulator with XRE-family HTH domain